ncbi:MAG: hypothetical protein CM1200mP28_11350 [Deltaproteobacteria bacterium]|nr:MAG: hypothetical protein CM1200mP28_11350 [Deltaproteobacteria bacterium]
MQDFIQQYIFPGGMFPSSKIVKEIATKQGSLSQETLNLVWIMGLP